MTNPFIESNSKILSSVQFYKNNSCSHKINVLQ